MAKQINYPLADDNESFYRRVLKGDKYIDRKTQLPTSRAFKLREQDDGELSVNVASLTTPLDSVSDATKYRLYEISHPDVKTCNEKAGEIAGYLCPIAENSGHGAIIGDYFDVEDEVTPGLLARKAKHVEIK